MKNRDYGFRWVRRKQSYKQKQELDNKVIEYNTQYCFNCHHTMTLDVKEEKSECSWCHTWNKNRTKGRYNYMMNRLLKKDYKLRRLDENGKEGKI